jgi:beta-galactosidase
LYAQKYRSKIDFDNGWKFSLDGSEKAIQPTFNDQSWRNIHLPHDWSIEGEYSLSNGSDWQSGYLPGGIGWYRKTFSYNPDWKNKQVAIQFDGVYMNSEVWINGQYLGRRPNGSLSFSYPIAKLLRNGSNTLVVKVDHSKVLSARWYTGSGINRHVWVAVTPKVHIAQDSVYVSCRQISAKSATVDFSVPVRNLNMITGSAVLKSQILNKQGVVVATASQSLPKSSAIAKQVFTVTEPQLWSPEHPYLYKVKSTLTSNGKVIDEVTLPMGIRKTEFSGSYGFKLNDVITKLKGVCIHEDAGAFGTAVPDEILLGRLKQLKDMGVNAIRTSHNPFSPQFYDMCDSLGLMVLNEAFDGWDKPKAKDDYGNYFDEWWERDLSAFIYRDRNHPSVIMWSIGNEVPKPTVEIQTKLINLVHKLDPSRPVTQGGVDPTRGMTDKQQRTLLDVKGFNGDGEEKDTFEKFHAQFPEVPMVGTEVPHTNQTRGVYRTTTNWRRRDFPAPWEIASGSAGTMKGLENRVFPIPDLAPQEVFPEEKATVYFKNDRVLPIPNNEPWSEKLFYQSSYDNATVRTNARKGWQRTMELPYVMGQFRWTAFDYLGESNQWPSRSANFGVIDLCGFPKDHFYLYQSLWTSKPMVHLLPHWTHPGKEGIAVPMVVYTNCDSVQLSLNGKSLGTQPYRGEQLVWNVPYTPGTIKVVAYKNGKIAASEQISTAGAAAKLSVSTNKKSLKSNGRDLLVCEINVTDKAGNKVPLAGNMLNFKVNGAATLKGTDNGDPLDLSSYQGTKRRAFRGKCLLILESTDKPGNVDLEISGEGLETYKLRLSSK